MSRCAYYQEMNWFTSVLWIISGRYNKGAALSFQGINSEYCMEHLWTNEQTASLSYGNGNDIFQVHLEILEIFPAVSGDIWPQRFVGDLW